MEAGDPAKHQAVASPRPGHADLAGALKYNFPDARYVLERASARESTARVAAGAFAKLMLRALGIEVASHVIRVGRVELDRTATWEEIAAVAAQDEVMLSCVDADDRSPHEGRGRSRPRAPATPWAASLKWWCTAFPPAWAPTPTGTSGSTGCWPGR